MADKKAATADKPKAKPKAGPSGLRETHADKIRAVREAKAKANK